MNYQTSTFILIFLITAFSSPVFAVDSGRDGYKTVGQMHLVALLSIHIQVCQHIKSEVDYHIALDSHQAR